MSVRPTIGASTKYAFLEEVPKEAAGAEFVAKKVDALSLTALDSDSEQGSRPSSPLKPSAGDRPRSSTVGSCGSSIPEEEKEGAVFYTKPRVEIPQGIKQVDPLYDARVLPSRIVVDIQVCTCQTMQEGNSGNPSIFIQGSTIEGQRNCTVKTNELFEGFLFYNKKPIAPIGVLRGKRVVVYEKESTATASTNKTDQDFIMTQAHWRCAGCLPNRKGRNSQNGDLYK